MLRTRFALAGAAALLAASVAQAGTLTSATWTQTVQGFPMSRTGGQIGITGTSTATSIAANLSYPQTTIKFFVPKTSNGTLDLAITITQGGPQAITATAGMAVGAPGIQGTVLVMTAKHAGMGVNQSMYDVGANTLVAVPVSVGAAGQFTGSFTVVGAQHYITVDFYAWTPGTQIFSGLTSGGSALPNVTAAGSFNLTANGGGSVTLVSASKISIDGSLAQQRTASFTTLKMTFVPEPGTLLLLGAGVLGLGLVLARKR